MSKSPDLLPGSSLALSMGKLWQVIQEQRDLNLPAHKVLPNVHVYHARCAALAYRMYCLPLMRNEVVRSPWWPAPRVFAQHV